MKSIPAKVRIAITDRCEANGLWQISHSIKLVDESFDNDTQEFYREYRYSRRGKTYLAREYYATGRVEVTVN